MDPVSRWAAFYRVVRRVPRGRVTTYGTVALLAGCPGYARHVGFALAALRGSPGTRSVPWQRVLAKESRRRARIALLDPVGAAAQRALLEAERVEVDPRGRVDLERFGWPTSAAPASRPRSPRRTRGSSGRS